ncbi:hypothetical protein V8E51_000449 [Hyaloscypha variabilis]
MSRNVVLSVNGRNGVDKSALGQPEQNWDLIRAASTSIHGKAGVDAPGANAGEPAGVLSVELLESQTRPEGFVVRTLAQFPENRIPQLTEILPHRDVVLQAIGGDGEPGRKGGDGSPGRDGIPGTNATKAQEATNGTDGGNGGRAGAGTNGADGGKGGKIQVCVDENNTHLLLAMSWEVSGGKGGASGEHGSPGLGGKGGKGGLGVTWEEQNGYQYRCTDNCAGRTTQPASSVKALASRTDPR